jgi:TOTE conflict system, Archaeo-Eukaryotic Primase domain
MMVPIPCTRHNAPLDGADTWLATAGLLATWTWRHWVNRTDVWGGYRPLHLRELADSDGKIWTKPARRDRGTKFLTEALIARHYAGRDVGHLIGLHSTSPYNASRWGAVDIDCHGPDSSAPSANQAAALAWYAKLVSLGFRPLLTESNGHGGYHLLVPFDEPVPTSRVFAFLRWLVLDYADYGLSAPPETFPKQARIEPGRYGNWLRLPGRHHTYDHWSRAWDGKTWLDAAGSVEYILKLPGSPPSCIPHEALVLERTVRPERKPNLLRPGIVRGDYLARRIQAYMARLPNLSAGQGRDDVAYNLAAFLVRDLCLSDAAALPWLVQWDQGNRPPKGDNRLKQIMANVHAYGTHAYGSGYQKQLAHKHRHERISFTARI